MNKKKASVLTPEQLIRDLEDANIKRFAEMTADLWKELQAQGMDKESATQFIGMYCSGLRRENNS